MPILSLQVFSATYNGYSTDELFFVRVSLDTPSYVSRSDVPAVQFNEEWGGRPWDARAKANLAKYVLRLCGGVCWTRNWD